MFWGVTKRSDRVRSGIWWEAFLSPKLTHGATSGWAVLRDLGQRNHGTGTESFQVDGRGRASFERLRNEVERRGE